MNKLHHIPFTPCIPTGCVKRRRLRVATLLSPDVGIGPHGQLKAGGQLSTVVDLGRRPGDLGKFWGVPQIWGFP